MVGKSRPRRDSIPDRPARSSVAIPTELPDPVPDPINMCQISDYSYSNSTRVNVTQINIQQCVLIRNYVHISIITVGIAGSNDVRGMQVSALVCVVR